MLQTLADECNICQAFGISITLGSLNRDFSRASFVCQVDSGLSRLINDFVSLVPRKRTTGGGKQADGGPEKARSELLIALAFGCLA